MWERSEHVKPVGFGGVGPYKLNPGKTLFLFRPEHPIRAACARISRDKRFTQVGRSDYR